VGVEGFDDSPILASSHSPPFLSPSVLPEHSLCKYLSITTPSYKPTLVPHNHDVTSKSGSPLGLTILHTPGHTPDSLSVWDARDRMLYVGDTLYQYAPIIFPAEGSIIEWWASMNALLDHVARADADIGNPLAPTARLSAGHTTAGQPADEILRATRSFIAAVLRGELDEKDREMRRGEDFVSYVQEGMRFSLICPERLIREAKKGIKL
jgi:glyoxylase-like metal-dependent hydrolase (beta-lactamase superfamily II)